MYLSILALPFLGSFISGFLVRKIGVTGAHFITCVCLILSSVLATIAFFEVGICNSPVIINLGSWIESDLISISWEFLFDQLTVSMFKVQKICIFLILFLVWFMKKKELTYLNLNINFQFPIKGQQI